jgi:hypothetical protein
MMLHCTIVTNRLYTGNREDKRRCLTVAFFTELFSRPRPRDIGRIRAAMAIVELLSETGRTDTEVRPADFPRLPRRIAAGV